MAEALGLASSIVALVQLSASVYSATSKFYREAKDANSRISALATQTRNLSGVLQNLSLLASAPIFDDGGVSNPDFRDTYMDACHTTLQKIKRKLDKAECDVESGSRRRLVTRSLKWPFAVQETNELIAELSQHREVLQLALSADTMSQLLQCLASTKSTAKSIQRLTQNFDRKATIDMRVELTKKREEVVRFFLKVNPEDHLQDCRSRRQPNTGRWLIERNETFQDWLDSPGSQIWLSGIPGAGKTMLCGTVIEEILQKQTASTAVAFFFCDYKYTQSHDPLNVLGALAVQLAKQGDETFELLESYYEELHPQNGIAKPPETKKLVEVTRAMTKKYDSVYLTVDGLDECGSKAVEVIRSLKGIAKGDRVNMALFSRNEPDIADELSDSITIEIAAHTEDLELYVLAQMENRKRLGSLAVKNPELHEHILRTLIQGANGMFRWVACQLDYLDGLPSDGRRRKALTELPPTLFETYDRILDRIMQEDEHSQDLCRKSLHWIGLGYRYFSPEALCEAISIPDDQDTVDKELLVDPEWILRSCSSLVRLAGQDSGFLHFQFAHFTVKEYLRSIKPQSKRSLFRLCEGEAIQSLLQTSVRFLTFPNFDQAPTIAVSEIQRMTQRNEQHPFYPVAAGYTFCSGGDKWNMDEALGDELALVLNDKRMFKYSAKLFDSKKTALFLSWVLQAVWYWPTEQLFEEDFARIIGLVTAPEFSTLHVAASLALPPICTYLIETQKVDINQHCRLGTPFHALLAGVSIYFPEQYFTYDDYKHWRKYPDNRTTAYDQCRQCLEIFIQHSADTSARWGNVSVFEMAINSAIRTEALWIVPLIIPSTVIDEARIDHFETAITRQEVDESFADAILTLGSNANAPPMWTRLASHIQRARMKERGHEGVNIPSDLQRRMSDEDFIDALRISLDQNLTDHLQSLVQDPRFRPDIYISTGDDAHQSEPILHFAIRAESFRLIKVLLEAGCDPEIIDETDGWTVLHQCAAWNTDLAAVTMLLLKSGVADSIQDELGKTCWHIAAENGNTSVLKALIELGNDAAKPLGTTSKQGRTPLASAILKEETDSALLLLDHCSNEVDVFRSDQSILDKAIAIGSGDLYPRLHEKMKLAGSEEALQESNPLDNINMSCSPKLVGYLLTTYATDKKTISDALATYLLDINNPTFEGPYGYPEFAKVHHIITQLLLPVGYGDYQRSPLDFWEVFCERVVVELTTSCKHHEHECREGLINMIFDILIQVGVLDTYERNARLPSYRVLFQSLLDRGEGVKCSWVASSVRRVIEASNLSEDLANDGASSKLLSLAVQQSSIDLVKHLLHYGINVHSAQKVLSPLEQACYSSDLPTFELVFSHANRSHINMTGNRGKKLLHWVICGTAQGYLSKIQRLLKLGADIDSKVDDPNADTALTLASRHNREDIATFLVSEGANSLHRAVDGWTILHAAALTGDLRYIQSLDLSQVPESFWRGTCQYPLLEIRIGPEAHSAQNDVRPTQKTTLITENVGAIHLAATKGRPSFLRFMAQHHLPFDVNAMAGFPTITPLQLACFFGHFDVVQFLLVEKADVNAKGTYGRLPIDLAAMGGNFAIVTALLKAGSKTPSNISSASMALLMSKELKRGEDLGYSKAMSKFLFEQAIITGDLAWCKDLVRRGQSINTKLFTHSQRPLVRAVVEGQKAVVDWLISSEVEVRFPAIDGLHPSMRCIASLTTHHIQCPSTLSAFMDLSLKQSVSWYGSTLGTFHVAILDNKMEVLETILHHVRKNDHAYRRIIETELICAPADSTNERSRTALSILVNSFNREEAFSINAPWREQLPPGSPLHWAIRKSNVSAVRALLRNEADANQVDSLGMTPLRLAVLSKHPAELVRELLHAGAGLAEPSRCRMNAMRIAVRNGDLELVKMLEEVDPEILKTVDQLSEIILLQSTGSLAVFHYLVSRGADPFAMKEIPDSAVTLLMSPNSRFRGFASNSGLANRSQEDSLAFLLVKMAYQGEPKNTGMVKKLYRALPSDVFTRIVNWTSRKDVGTALCTAASVDAAGMVEVLINIGAELESEGCRYGSPLMAACAWGNLDAARCLVRRGALLSYVNEEGVLRSAFSAASRHQKVMKWLLVGRYTDQPKIDYQPSHTTAHESVWSGPRLFKLALPTYMHRDFGESSWSHLRRLQKWREDLHGSTLAESRRDSGLDLWAGFDAEARITDAEAAHHSFLMTLGEV